MGNGNLQIRKANEVKDLVLIREIALNTWPDTFSSILTTTQIDYMLELMYSISSLEAQVNEKQYQFVIGFESERAVGFAGYELNSLKTCTKIHKLYFLPESHGKGYGKEMINYIKAISLQDQINKLTLNVNRFNRAISFYEHLGFKIIGEEVIDIGSGYIMDDYIMELSLS